MLAVLLVQTLWDQAQGNHGLTQVITHRIQDTTRMLRDVHINGPGQAATAPRKESVITRIGTVLDLDESRGCQRKDWLDTLWELRQRRVLAEHASRFKFLSNDNGARPKRACTKRARSNRAC